MTNITVTLTHINGCHLATAQLNVVVVKRCFRYTHTLSEVKEIWQYRRTTCL